MPSAKYTQGSISRHLMIMTLSATTGLMVMFFSDLVDMYFLSLLGEIEIAAAVGFAGSILFFTISMNIGLSIACGALVSQALGSGDQKASKEAVTYSFVSAFLFVVPVTIIFWYFIPSLLQLLGAEGRALELSSQYLSIIILSMPLLALAMSASGVMRARGDAKGAMWLSMIGGLVNVVMDPIFIFGFGLGVKGAAIATVISRLAMVAFGYYVVVYRNRLLGVFIFSHYKKQFNHYIKVAIPAVLTNLSTPIGIAYVTYAMAQFGDSAVAGNAIISRIQPVAFAGLFALSGIVGPIAGQNFGANQLGRVKQTLIESIRLTIAYCIVVCLILWILRYFLIDVFEASDEANQLILLFCSGVSAMFVFNGITFMTNALFNNIGLAHYATAMNLLKATVGTVPFVSVGAWLAGPAGILWGIFLGSIIMAIIGLILAIRVLNRLSRAT